MDGYRISDIERTLRGRYVRYVQPASYARAEVDPLGLNEPEGVEHDAVRFELSGGQVLTVRVGHALLTRAEPTVLNARPVGPDGLVDEPVREDCDVCVGTGKVDVRARLTPLELEDHMRVMTDCLTDTLPNIVAEGRLTDMARYELSRLHAMLTKELGL